MKRTIIIVYTILISHINLLNSNTFKPITKISERTLSLDSGYLPAQNSNRALAGFNTEVLMGLGAAYDAGYSYFQPESSVTRALYYEGFWLATFPIAASTLVTFHEFGHGSRMYSIGGIPQYKHTLGTASNYFSEWLMLMFNGYFVLPMTGSFIAAASPNLNIEKINKHYDHLKQYVDTDQLKQYLYFSEILQTFRKRLKSDTALQKIFEEAEKMTQKDGMAYLKQHVSDEEYNALEFANDKEKHHRMLSPKAQIMIHAGGLNNNVYMTQRIEDEIWLNQGQHMQLTTNYFMDKTSTFLQTLLTSEVLSAEKLFSNIPLDYVCVLDTWSNDLDIKISRTELQLYSILSYFLSAQTYMNMYQVYQTWMNGENQVYPAEWKGIRLPNVGLYLTTKGPTYNVRSGYRWGESLFFIVGTEFVLNGKQVIEGTLGIRKVFPTVGNSYIHGEVVFNHEAVGGTLYGGSKLFNTVNIEAGITYHNVNTLLGERHIPSLLTGSTDIETWIKLGVQY